MSYTTNRRQFYKNNSKLIIKNKFTKFKIVKKAKNKLN